MGDRTGISSRAEKLRQQIASSREERLLLAHKCVSLTRKQNKSIASASKDGSFIDLDHNSNNGNLLVAAFRKGITHSILGEKLEKLTQKQHAELSLQITSAACATVPCACNQLLRSPKPRKISTNPDTESGEVKEITLFFCAVCGGYIPKQGGCGSCTGLCDSNYPCFGCKNQNCPGGCCCQPVSTSPISIQSNNSNNNIFFSNNPSNSFYSNSGSNSSTPIATPKGKSSKSLLNSITAPPLLINYYYDKKGIPLNNIVLPTLHRISDWLVNGELYSLPPIIKKPPIMNYRNNNSGAITTIASKNKPSGDSNMPLYESIRLLGRGSFGEVTLIKNPVDSKLFAMKSILCNNKHQFHMVMREIQFLRINRHPYVMDIHDAFIITHNSNSNSSSPPLPPLTMYYIMPYCESGTLDSVINNSKRNNIFLNESQIIKYLIQICLGLQCLHSNNCIHRDLKPQNLLLMEGGDVVKIADFGLAITVNKQVTKNENNFLSIDDKLINTEAGTPYYSSPELILCQGYSYPLDLWSLGIILYQLMSLVRPFEGNSTADLVKKILYLEPKIPPSHYSDDLKGICHDLLIKSSKKRLALNDLLCHPLLFNKILTQPSNYRPKFIEERVKRNLIKQLEVQVDVVNKLKKYNDKIIIREQQLKKYHQLNKKVDSPPPPGTTTSPNSPPNVESDVHPYTDEDSEELIHQLNKYSKTWRFETITSDYRIDQNIDEKKSLNNNDKENSTRGNNLNSLLVKKTSSKDLTVTKPIQVNNLENIDKKNVEEVELEVEEDGEGNEEDVTKVDLAEESGTKVCTPVKQNTYRNLNLTIEIQSDGDPATEAYSAPSEVESSVENMPDVNINEEGSHPDLEFGKGGIIGLKLAEALEIDQNLNLSNN